MNPPTPNRILLYQKYIEELIAKHGKDNFNMAIEVTKHSLKDVEYWLEIAAREELNTAYKNALLL